MSADPISCTLLAAASISTGIRRANRRGASTPSDEPIDPLGAAVAVARQQARSLHIPDSTVDSHLEQCRRRGQPDLAALNELIARARALQARG
jgi:hypothetical protein